MKNWKAGACFRIVKGLQGRAGPRPGCAARRFSGHVYLVQVVDSGYPVHEAIVNLLSAIFRMTHVFAQLRQLLYVLAQQHRVSMDGSTRPGRLDYFIHKLLISKLPFSCM